MVLGERNQKVQAFPPERAQESLAEGIRLGTPHRGFEDSQPQVAYTLVELLGEDRIAVMNQKTVRVIRWDRLAQLLERPLTPWDARSRWHAESGESRVP